MRMVDTSPDRISLRRNDSEWIICFWRSRRKHLTLTIEKRRRVVAFRRIV